MRFIAVLLVFAVASLASVLGAGELRAATIDSIAASKPLSPLSRTDAVESPRLRLTGMIEAGDAEKLRDLLVKLQASAPPKPGMPLATIELSSLGGNLSEGVRIGELLRSFKIVAVVRKEDLCVSACALALLGGNAVRAVAAYP